MNIVTKIYSILFFILFSECTTVEGNPEPVEIDHIEDRSLNFLVKKNLLKNGLNLDDVKKALCLDLKLGENYDKIIVYFLKRFFDRKVYEDLFSLLLEKFIRKLSSNDDESKIEAKYKVDVKFNIKKENVLDDDAKFRILNVFSFFVMRFGKVGERIKVCFDDFDLTLLKRKAHSSDDSKNEYDNQNKHDSDTCSELSSRRECTYFIFDLTNEVAQTPSDICENVFKKFTIEKEQIIVDSKNLMEIYKVINYNVRKFVIYLEGVFELLESIGGSEYKKFYCEIISKKALRDDVFDFCKEKYSQLHDFYSNAQAMVSLLTLIDESINKIV